MGVKKLTLPLFYYFLHACLFAEVLVTLQISVRRYTTPPVKTQWRTHLYGELVSASYVVIVENANSSAAQLSVRLPVKLELAQYNCP